MTATVFKALSWAPNEVVAEAKMDTMVDNIDWLFNNTPRAIYTVPGIARVEGIRVCSGRALISRSSTDAAYVDVTFGNYFSNGCQPNITTGIITDNQTQVFCVVHGNGKLIPDHTGFRIEVNIAATDKAVDKISRGFYITWHAIGY